MRRDSVAISKGAARFARVLRALVLIPLWALPAAACSSDTVVPATNPTLETPAVGGDGAGGTISVSPGTTFQTIDGFGSSQRMFDDPHLNGLPNTASTGGIVMTAAQRDTIYELLYGPTSGIGLNRLRVPLTQPGWQTEEGGRITPDGPYPGPRATAALDFIKNALRYNPNLQTGFQVGTYDGWINNATLPLRIAEYVKSSLDFAKTRGVEPQWIGIQNEPSLTNFSGDNLRDIVVELRGLLKADGRYSARVSAPDDVSDVPGAAKARTILADPVARSFVSSLSIHLYGNERPSEMAALSAQYSMPLWMTEYDARTGGNEIGWGSTIVHEMLVTYNWSAVDILFGFFGAADAGSAIVSYISLKSSGTIYKGYTLNPAYFQMGQWSRYVTRGSVRIDAESTTPEVKVSAFVKGGKKVIVLINTATGHTRSMTIPAGKYRLVRTAMKGTDRLADKGLFTSAVNLPPASITTLIEQ